MKMSSATCAAMIVLASCSAQQASTEPSVSATPGATASAPQSSMPSSQPPAFEDVSPGTELAPGTYVLHYASIGGADEFPTLAMTFTVPASWERVRVDGLVWNDSGARLWFVVADNIYAEPCDPGAGLQDPPVGPTVDDLAQGLVALPGWQDAEIDEISFSDFGGEHVSLTVPADVEACPDEESRLFHTLGSPGYAPAPGPGEQIEIWVLNVEGTRLVIGATAMPEASAELRAELQEVVDSIEIQS